MATLLYIIFIVSATLWRQTLKSPQSLWRRFFKKLFKVWGSSGRAYPRDSHNHAFLVITTWSYSQLHNNLADGRPACSFDDFTKTR